MITSQYLFKISFNLMISYYARTVITVFILTKNSIKDTLEAYL